MLEAHRPQLSFLALIVVSLLITVSPVVSVMANGQGADEVFSKTVTSTEAREDLDYLFAAIIKDFSVGTLIGEETGGLASCFGGTYRSQLANSGLSLRISYKYFVRPGNFDDGRGVLPDISAENKKTILFPA